MNVVIMLCWVTQGRSFYFNINKKNHIVRFRFIFSNCCVIIHSPFYCCSICAQTKPADSCDECVRRSQTSQCICSLWKCLYKIYKNTVQNNCGGDTFLLLISSLLWNMSLHLIICYSQKNPDRSPFSGAGGWNCDQTNVYAVVLKSGRVLCPGMALMCSVSLSRFLLLWSAVLIMYPTTLAVIALTFSSYILQPVFPDCTPPYLVTRMLSATCLRKSLSRPWFLHMYLISLCCPSLLNASYLLTGMISPLILITVVENEKHPLRSSNCALI